MKDQITDLFCAQYAYERQEFIKYFDSFYNTNFQIERKLIIVGLEGKHVIGFQSFFYWPYKVNGKVYNSYQSGNSLVHPDHRGKGIFQQLLNFLYTNNKHLNIDFLIGFPIAASINSLKRNGWENILNLSWFVRSNSLISIFYGMRSLSDRFDEQPITTENDSINAIQMENSLQFLEWRSGFNLEKRYFFNYAEQDMKISFQVKLQRRKSYLNELVVGYIFSNSKDADFVERGFRVFLKHTRKAMAVLFSIVG